MSTQQILGVVGGVVGAFFGYPQLGFVVGSLVGGLLTPGEKTEGPRVDDLKVQVSTYGVGIPLVYGTERVGGNVVWSTDKIEVEETTGGKGGGPENTTYRYYVHMGVVLCETPRDGSTVSIVGILQDGKLIWDSRSTVPIGSALASSENPHAYFVLYQGHADQLPDPGEEAWMGGPGSVPAYRGVVRVRMNAIECPGGRVPQFSFIISTSATAITTTSLIATVANQSDVPGSTIKGYMAGFNGREFSLMRVTGTQIRVRAVRDASYIDYEALMVDTGLDNYVQTGWSTESAVMMWDDTGGNDHFYLYKADGVVIPIVTPFNGTGAISAYNDSNFVIACNVAPYYYYAANADVSWSGTLGGAAVNCCVGNGFAYVIRFTGGVNDIAVIDMETGVLTSMAAPEVNQQNAHIMLDGEALYYVAGLNILYRRVGAAWVQWMTSVPAADWEDKRGISNEMLYTLRKNDGKYFISFRGFTTSDVMVKDIISDQCDRADESRYDVSEIPDTDTLHGFKLQNPASARSNIDPLLTAFAIYIVDEDGLIKFKKYEDIVSEATVTYDELGQAEDGSEPADAMPLNRAQEIDMPRSVSVSYIEPTFDYQTASEKEVRQITEATEDMIIELPMATTSDHAKQVASMILFAKWRAQNTRSFKTSRKFSFLSPGDGVTVEYPRGTFRLWRITSMTDTGALCEFNVEPGDAELYTQTAVGATGYTAQEVEALAPPTRAQILDIPALRDVDNDAGPYVALDSYGPVPAQAELFVGVDDANLQPRGTVSASAPIGIAESVPGAWTRNLVDESSTFIVDLGDDVFESVTRDVLLAGGGEFWALGAAGRWEIGASALGADLGSGRYILSRHLRGLFGTEQYTGTHQAGDTFVLLRIVGILRPSTSVGEIGLTKSYRAVTKGRSLNSASSQTYANTGESLKPLSPINIRRSTSTTNDVTLTVDRRSRMSMNNATGTLPVGEASESYTWDFYSSSGFSTRVGSLTSVTGSLTITSAQQTAFGLTPGAQVHVRVYQMSDSVGLGHELEANV